MNIGTKQKTLDKFMKVVKLVSEGVAITVALKRIGLSPSTFYEMKAKHEPKQNETP